MPTPTRAVALAATAWAVLAWGCRIAPAPPVSTPTDPTWDLDLGGDDDDSGTGTGGDSGTQDSGATDTGGDTGEPPPLPDGPVTIYAVRHAEKESEGSDPGLTEDGLARAEALAELLHDVPLVAVYATEYQRTQLTVQPTADDHGLPVQIDFHPEDELADHILTTHGDETVLHGGHSNTLPDFFEALGVPDDDAPSGIDYGAMWIVSIDVDGSTTIVETTYGE